MDILRFDLLIITTLLLAFGLILIATQADGAIDIEVRSKTNYQLLTTNQYALKDSLRSRSGMLKH